jgi:hypothetical protein
LRAVVAAALRGTDSSPRRSHRGADYHDRSCPRLSDRRRLDCARGGAPRVRPAPLVVISAGSNDPDNPRLVANLTAIRQRAGSSRVVWVLPVNGRAASAVAAVARRSGDRTVAFAPGRDHVHPRCPRCLAAAIFGSST